MQLHIIGADGSRRDRIPACIRRAVQDPTTHDYCGQIWNSPKPYVWKHEFDPGSIKAPLIYESHVGMAGEEPRVHTYREFADHVLPRIATGELAFGIGMSEPDSGSDLAATRTRAVRDGDVYRVTGTKVWTSFAHEADYVILFCRTSGTPADRHQGTSQLLVEVGVAHGADRVTPA